MLWTRDTNCDEKGTLAAGDNNYGGQGKLTLIEKGHYDEKGTLTEGDNNYCKQGTLTMMEKGH